MARKYEQRKRAEQQEETRERIVRAAVDLHRRVGPARTSLSAIAEEAGVQRNTLYRHFPDERSLFQACSGAFFAEHPLPDPASWTELADPVERARHALRELYAYWEDNEDMTANVLRDGEVHELVREMSARRGPAMAALADAIVTAWPRGRRRKRLVAAAELAIGFRTWQSLVRSSGLSSNAAADLMATTLDCAAQT